MRQQRLGFKREKTIKSAVRGYDVGNAESAKIILADEQKYGGPTSGLVIWAHMALRRIEAEQVHQ
jgi:hypothetical protein